MAASIETAVREGLLTPGAPLPTVRALATRLGLSPTTVSGAYRALRGRGLLVGRGRRGTRVSARPPIAFSPAPELPEHVRNLATGNPDPAFLPDLGPALAKLETRPRLYGQALLDPELARLAHESFSADGIPAECVSVAGGALDAIERILQAQLRPGDRIAVEDPGFTGVLDLVAALGLEAVPVAVDDAGPLPEALEAALARRVEALVVTPRAQNPTGAAITAERARVLGEQLRAHPELLVIEDDHMGELAGAPYATLLRPERRRRAAVRSVSKWLGPDLRLAVVAADSRTTARVEGRQLVGVRWVSFVLQQLAVALWKERSVRAARARAARTYTKRREAALAALAAHGIPARGRSGHNIWIPVSDEARTLQGLQEAGWAVAAGARFRIESPPAIRVTTADLEPAEAERFAQDLARLLAPAGRTHAA